MPDQPIVCNRANARTVNSGNFSLGSGLLKASCSPGTQDYAPLLAVQTGYEIAGGGGPNPATVQPAGAHSK